MCSLPIVGAMALAEYRIAKDLYLHCMHLVQYFHDSMDITVVPALIHMMGNSYFTLDPERATTVAVQYAMMAEAILICNHRKHSEVTYSL